MIFDGIVVAHRLQLERTNRFSQVIAAHEGKHSIASTEGIAHWLEAKSKEDIISLLDARLGDVLRFEPEDTCIHLKANDTVDQAREIFANDIGKRIFSALITEHGYANEEPINIVTPWDFVAGELR